MKTQPKTALLVAVCVLAFLIAAGELVRILAENFPNAVGGQ